MGSATINVKAFDADVLRAQRPVLVDFWASWCGPCKTLSAMLDELARDLASDVDVIKVNVDENPEVAAACAVVSLPTLILFKEGRQLSRKIGLTTRSQLERWIAVELGVTR